MKVRAASPASSTSEAKELRTILVRSFIAAVAAVAVPPAPASAAGSGTTPLTAEVDSGALDITVPTTSVSLGSVIASTSPQTVTSQIGDVTVTDGRGGTVGWTATANAVDFTGPQNIPVSAAGSSSYTSPSAGVTGTTTVTNALTGTYSSTLTHSVA